jgi:uncharacterized protein (DUF433 family)
MSNSSITVNCDIMLGKPVVKGTRLTVELLLRKLLEGAAPADLLAMYPRLKSTDVQAVIAFTHLK